MHVSVSALTYTFSENNSVDYYTQKKFMLLYYLFVIDKFIYRVYVLNRKDLPTVYSKL